MKLAENCRSGARDADNERSPLPNFAGRRGAKSTFIDWRRGFATLFFLFFLTPFRKARKGMDFDV